MSQMVHRCSDHAPDPPLTITVGVDRFAEITGVSWALDPTQPVTLREDGSAYGLRIGAAAPGELLPALHIRTAIRAAVLAGRDRSGLGLASTTFAQTAAQRDGR